mgnify:CR=1 FL=1
MVRTLTVVVALAAVVVARTVVAVVRTAVALALLVAENHFELVVRLLFVEPAHSQPRIFYRCRVCCLLRLDLFLLY